MYTSTAFSVSSVLRVRTEEGAGRAELLLSTALSRRRWITGSLAVTAFASIINVVLIGVVMGATHGLVTGEWERFGGIAGSAVGLLPAELLVLGAAVLLLGWLPRGAHLAWVVFGFALLQSYLGELLRFPRWLDGLSPFTHLAQVPTEPFEIIPAAVLTALTGAAVALGVSGALRRDIG